MGDAAAGGRGEGDGLRGGVGDGDGVGVGVGEGDAGGGRACALVVGDSRGLGNGTAAR